ncbi:MAG: hypothetical protein WC107_01610 [Patescibacteria group bacterium]
MIKKYLCMKEGEEFVTEDEHEAMDHLDLGMDHEIVEIEMQDHRVESHVLGRIAGPEIEEEYEV